MHKVSLNLFLSHELQTEMGESKWEIIKMWHKTGIFVFICSPYCSVCFRGKHTLYKGACTSQRLATVHISPCNSVQVISYKVQGFGARVKEL